MQKASGLPAIEIGPSGIAAALSMLTSGTPVDVTGASGPLPFSGKGDITTADIQVWCVPPASSGTDVGAPALNSGYYYDSASATMKGCTGMAAACGFTAAPACL